MLLIKYYEFQWYTNQPLPTFQQSLQITFDPQYIKYDYYKLTYKNVQQKEKKKYKI